MVSWGMSTFKEIYVSVDVEANGPIPGPYSLTSIGAFTAGGLTSEGEYVSFDHGDEGNKFYVELAPISPDYNPRAIQVGLLEGFDPSTAAEDGSDHFAWTQEHGVEAGEAMRSFAEWVAGQRVVHGGRPIFMAYPASFDWTFVYWYFQRYGVESPFGFSGVLDLKSAYAAKAGVGVGASVKRRMAKHLFPDLPHTHHALDDATEQGVFGMNILRWDGS